MCRLSLDPGQDNGKTNLNKNKQKLNALGFLYKHVSHKVGNCLQIKELFAGSLCPSENFNIYKIIHYFLKFFVESSFMQLKILLSFMFIPRANSMIKNRVN